MVDRQVVLHPGYLAKLEIDIESQKEGFGRLYSNYKIQKLDLESHLCFDLLLDSDSGEIVGGAGVFNGGRYPDGVYRVLNRSFIMPKFRTKGLFPLLNTRHLLVKQLKDYRQDIKLAFVSRQGRNGAGFLTWWTKKFGALNESAPKWTVEHDFVHVAPGSNRQSGFHNIAWASFEQVDWSPKKIGLDQWLSLEP